MACDKQTLYEYLSSFDGLDPVSAVVCPFTQDAGLGVGLAVFSLLFFGPLGLAMTVRTQHPGPLIVAGILTIGAIAGTLPGQAAEVAAVVFFFAIAGAGLYLYQRAQSSL